MNKSILLLAFMAIYMHLDAQVYNEDRHNTNYNAAWISCSESVNPNSQRGTGHWISYNLRRTYDIYGLSFWNLNDPARLNEGLQEIVIDISNDGNEWTEMGTYTIPQSEGSAYYIGSSGIDLNGSSARYVLITAINNYGGSCYGLSEVKINVQESVLPVTLIDFMANCNDDGSISITWEVESEYNNESYTCQSSLDGKSWTDVKTIPGENKKQKNTYTIIDNSNKNEKVYYRVWQKDFDGSTSYFPIIQALCDFDNNYLEIYPNPTESLATITFSSHGDHHGSYHLTDIGGKIIKRGNLTGKETEIDFSYLSPGTYFITISDESQTFQRKIIKI